MSGERASGLAVAKMATPRGVSALRNFFTSETVSAMPASSTMQTSKAPSRRAKCPSDSAEKETMLERFLAVASATRTGLGCTDVDQARTALEQPSRQRRQGGADEQHTPAAGDGLRVGG